MTQEVMKLALEALEFDGFTPEDATHRIFTIKAITAIKEALAQPEQEPVGQLLEDAFGRGQVMWFNKPKDESMLYTTPPQRTEQEPVAYLCENAVGHRYFRWKKPSSTYKPIALYTSPPQRTWVGLTDEEISEITSKVIGFNSCAGWEEDYAKAIEQALKEKNT